MLSLEQDLYVLECERRFELERAELRIKRGIAEEIDNAGLGFPDWLTALGRGLRDRLVARRRPATLSELGTVLSSACAQPATLSEPEEAVAAAIPVSRRLCAGEHRRQSLICDDCGAVIRTSKPVCSTTARRARKVRGATKRQTV